MATVKGPLFSIGASGTLGGAIVFSTWKGRPYVRQHAVPANPKSRGQLGVRAMLAFISQAWDALSDANKTTWEEPAESDNVSPFNAYIKTNMLRNGVNLAPSHYYPVVDEGNSGEGDAPIITAQSRSLNVRTSITGLGWNWAIAVYRSLADDIVGSRTELVHVHIAEAVANYDWLDFPLTPGVEVFYKSKPIGYDGNYGTLSAVDSATPNV